MSSVRFLGTGPGSPVRGRGHSSCLLECGGARLLVDAGEPCSRRLLEAGVSLEEIDAVLITHGHADHTGGLPMLVQAAWLAPRRRMLPIYLPAELIKPLASWLEAIYLPPSLLGFRLDWRPWRVGHGEEVAKGVVVTPFATSHLQGLQRLIDPAAAGRFEVFGLAVRGGGGRVVFSSDLGAPEDLREVLAAPCDLLVCELSHFSPAELFAFLRDRSIGCLALNHLAAEWNGREEELLELARAALPGVGRVVVPDDGTTVEF